jgi:flavin reductase (DIM6/NTAB) family NADH-FMN oxidoreductase RutF
MDPGGDGDSPTGAERLRRRVLWALPTGLYLVGSRAQGRANLMTANLVVQVATAPVLLAAAVEAGSLTRTLIDDGGTFTLSLLSPDDRAVVRRFVKPVEAAQVVMLDGRLASLRTEPVLEAPGGAPVLARAVAWVDCRVRQRLELGSHVLFVGEVAAVDGPPGEVGPVLSMRDTRMNYGG